MCSEHGVGRTEFAGCVTLSGTGRKDATTTTTNLYRCETVVTLERPSRNSKNAPRNEEELLIGDGESKASLIKHAQLPTNSPRVIHGSCSPPLRIKCSKLLGYSLHAEKAPSKNNYSPGTVLESLWRAFADSWSAVLSYRWPHTLWLWLLKRSLPHHTVRHLRPLRLAVSVTLQCISCLYYTP